MVVPLRVPYHIRILVYHLCSSQMRIENFIHIYSFRIMQSCTHIHTNAHSLAPNKRLSHTRAHNLMQSDSYSIPLAHIYQHSRNMYTYIDPFEFIYNICNINTGHNTVSRWFECDSTHFRCNFYNNSVLFGHFSYTARVILSIAYEKYNVYVLYFSMKLSNKIVKCRCRQNATT